MLLTVVISCLALISANAESDLHKYFNLIDRNRDGKVFSDELFVFFNAFYEEEPDQLLLTPTKARQIEKQIIRQYTRNSTANYLTLADLERLFLDLYGIQNQRPPFSLNGYEPEQVHLSYTHNVFNEMFISFVTRERPAGNLRPIVKYCAQGCLALGETTTYNVDDWHYWIHYIHIRGLQPGTKYDYKLGFIEPDNVTVRHLYTNELWTFKTVPAEDQQGTEIVYIYGDMGTVMPLGFEVMKTIVNDFHHEANERADYVVHVGDIAYAGTGSQMEVQTIWDLFMNQIAPIASQMPYMTATGNHEKYYNYTSYRTRFFMPSKTDPTPWETDGNFFFSLETNLVQWVFLSTEHNYTVGSPQRRFFENILDQFTQKWRGQPRPWLIVVGHRPMYSSDQATDSGRLQEQLESVLITYGVDLAVWGHMHCYERTTPVQYNRFTDKEHVSADGKVYSHNATLPSQTSPIHLTIGNAGAWIHESWIPKPEWSQARYQEYGFGKLFVYNRTHLEFRSMLVNRTAVDAEDRFMIIRQF